MKEKEKERLIERFCDKYALVDSNGKIVRTFRTKQRLLNEKYKLNHENYQKLRLADIDIKGNILQIYKVGDNHIKSRVKSKAIG